VSHHSTLDPAAVSAVCDTVLSPWIADAMPGAAVAVFHRGEIIHDAGFASAGG